MKQGKIRDMDLDLKEWVWTRAGHIKEGPFFDYTIKRRYKIINTRQEKTPRFSIEMTNQAYNAYQCKQFYKDLWHNWIPRKISTKVWLICQEGLHLAKWCMSLGPRHTGICNLCMTGAFETPEHNFYDCPSVIGVWDRVCKMRQLAGLHPRLNNWWEALSGVYDPPGQPGATIMYHTQTQTLDMQGSPTEPTMINEKPWEILHLCLIWYLWCQKYEYDLRNGDFHIGVALFQAWQTTIQAAIGA
jgi:hypothetical protein